MKSQEHDEAKETRGIREVVGDKIGQTSGSFLDRTSSSQ